MIPAKRIDRKLFLTWGLTSTSIWAVGCGDDAAALSGAGGSGGSGPAGSAGTASSGAAGTFATPGGTSTGGASAGQAGASSAGQAGSAGGSAVAPSCAAQLTVFITANHGHTFQVTAADVTAAAPKAYATKGLSDHEHWVQLTAADFAKLQAGGTVRKVTCNDGHEHEFIVNCVGNATPETTSGVANFCDAEHKCGDTDANFCGAVP